MDARASLAREHHRNAGEASRASVRHRQMRDRLVRQIWNSARSEWTYAKLAAAVGCSPELIAKIVRSDPEAGWTTRPGQ